MSLPSGSRSLSYADLEGIYAMGKELGSHE